MGGRGLRVFEDEKKGLGFFSLLFVLLHYLLFLRFHCCWVRMCISHFQSAWRRGGKIKKNNNSLCKQTTTHRQHNTQDQEGASPRVYTRHIIRRLHSPLSYLQRLRVGRT